MFAKRVSAATRLFRQSASWISRAGLGTGLVGTIAFASRHSTCASPDGEISQADVANMSKTTTASPVFKIARNTTATDLQDGGAMLDRDVFARSNHVFSHLVPKQGKATNQASSGRCWLFAYLNQVRQQMMIDLDLPESFELSQNYLFFFDKLERCNYILECYIQTAGEDLDSRRVQHLLKSPSEDGGQYSMIQAVVSKYGIVPQSAYPEATGGCRSVHMRRVMNVKMREFCKDLREAVARGATRKELDAMKRDMMAIIYRILATHLGEPPKKFDWEYVNTKKEYHEVRDITPKEFAEKHAGMSNVKEFVSLVNDPRNKYYRTYTVDMLGNVVGTDTPVLYLNVPMDVLKQVAATEIAEGRSVWFGSDVGKDFVRKFSMLGPEYQDMGEVYGTTSGLTKGDRLRYGQSLMTHAMLLTGVHVPGCGTRKVTTGKGKGKDEKAGGSSSPIDASKVTKWRIQNSWGTRLGNEGYLTATDAWMDEWCYQVVVEKHRLPERARIALETEPVVLPPWDPMGALAVGFEAEGEAEALAAGAADEGRE